MAYRYLYTINSINIGYCDPYPIHCDIHTNQRITGIIHHFATHIQVVSHLFYNLRFRKNDVIVFNFIAQFLSFKDKFDSLFQRFVFKVQRNTLIHVDIIYIKEKRLSGLFSYSFKSFLNRHIL